jgi:uncharacterized XkdX family phage protein
MTDFERVKMYYDNGWATNQQVAKYVYYEKITPEQYEEITGEPYTV